MLHGCRPETSGAPVCCSRVPDKPCRVSLQQCMSDGKSIVMEGVHLDPGLYLYEFGRHSPAHALREGPDAAVQPLPSTAHASEGNARPAHAHDQQSQQPAGRRPGLRVEVHGGDEEHPRCAGGLLA